MAKKRSKKSVKKKVSKKVAGKSVAVKKRSVGSRRFGIVVKNLILFLILTVFSFLLNVVSVNEFLKNFFALLTIILAFVSVAFLVVLLILLFLRLMYK